ncbi:MAG: VWA domain-containing protein [Mariprofundus sp.]|nr:VWA domain-containing protein [Mariprofundus sp.]
MASGLGAIILVLIIVKQDVDKSSPEVDLLQGDLVRIQAQHERVKKSLHQITAASIDELSQITSIQAQIATLKATIATKGDRVAGQQGAVLSIQKALTKTPIAHADDVVNSAGGGEENYIMGLKLEGRKIVLLVDRSASMTDEKLIDIIRRKNSSDDNKKKGPKWQRSKRIVHWLLARVPKSSQVAVVVFNRKAMTLAGGWLRGRDSGSIQRLFKELDKVIPTGATNLQVGLQKVRSLQPTNLYLITDGLPTAGQSSYASLNPFSACGGLLGSSSTISGVCRIKLFQQSLIESAPARGVKVNVILLPIEGDPQAAPQYWRWSSATGGLLISPAQSWP